MNEIEKYYQSLMQDIAAMQASSEDGDTQEQTFTRIAIDILSDAGETENADIAYDEKDIGRKGQHKINAYAVSENYETVDLFISIFDFSEFMSSIAKSEIDRATIRITNFFKKTVEKDYVNDVAESSPIFEFANTLANFQELKENLVRVNATILTNGEYKGDFPPSDIINGYSVFYRIIDINYLYKISEQSRVPIELDFKNFEGEEFKIPCLSATTENLDYKTYIAIIPGTCLAKLYERYGARLLEQNVRSFLQFTGKINKGIRDTIRNEPHMFLAFNNGIAATADHIELDETGHFINKISNLQIVNGGQTTASIYNTARKDKADISNIFVQIKFSIIEKQDLYSDIVSRISRYANTQNKVNDADFSANNPALITFEKLSRYIMSPITSQNNMQTCWFFERARGQYKTLRSREGRTKSLQNAFDKKYPKGQMFTKVELAKYINSYQEIYDGVKLVVGPHIVVRGNEKNYAQFIANNLPDNINKINNVYFEDSIAKCILFKNADKRYGKKPDSIGEMKQVVVPYTLSLLNIITNNKLDLYKIWKNQQVSLSLSNFIYDLMKQVNQFILENSPVSHYIEWAKKEECWEKVKSHSWAYNINDIKTDLIDEKNPLKRNTDINISEEELIKNRETVKSIPSALWNEIGKWGKDSGYFDITKQNIVSNIAYKLRQNKVLADEECQKGIEILDIVASRNQELLQESEKYTGKWVQMKKVKITDDDKNSLILEQVRKMLSFNTDKNILLDEETDFLFDILNQKRERDYDADETIVKCMQKLIKKGFPI
ncbi:AIPR family protein [Dysgonomonas sp. Marseille-P4677]|uniref:AIPR family protein n=1 Tax=Dysgonomonas sp. Marseille-P4677 TaxID=2364790 RepID=UPI001912BC04|nr:AIPR family protein [Dysgonomonas sp. Marseille-P4677]MBK5719545.1 AIPR family protein [Dysgonomonas sp. Marseille-P4677]